MNKKTILKNYRAAWERVNGEKCKIRRKVIYQIGGGGSYSLKELKEMTENLNQIVFGQTVRKD